MIQLVSQLRPSSIENACSQRGLEREIIAKRDTRRRETSPFVDVPRAEARDAHWVEPVLVAEVEFTEWSRDGRLRHPPFQELREDKPARQITAERSSRG